MATNVIVTLPAPAGNGIGVSVDVSTMGAEKTIAVGSSGGVFEPIVTIEVSQDDISYAPIRSFNGKDEKTVLVVCHYMRQRVAKFFDGSNPSVGVGGAQTQTSFTSLAVPAASGSGAASVASGLESLKTVQVGGDFRGVVNVEISDDGGTTYTTVMSFSAAGFQSEIFTADHIRVTRGGVPTVSPGLPTVIVADTAGISSGAGVSVRDEGVDIGNNPHAILNFTGPGVVATDAGAGVATIEIDGTGDLGWFGTHVDGNLAFDGVNPVVINGTSIAPVAGVYTMPNPPGDVFCNVMTVSAAADFVTNGYKFYGDTLHIIAGGHVSHNGGNGVAASGAGGGAGGAGAAAGTLLGGGTGQSGTGEVDTGTQNSPLFPSRSTPSGGGAGGAGGGGAGAGGVSSPQPGTGTYMIGTMAIGDGTSGGSGGGAGGANGDGNFSGGAGGGGGVMVLSFRTFNVPANAIRAKGGAGAAGRSAGGAVGGSGGGQGGVIYIVTNDSAAPVCDVSGGAAAAGISGGVAGSAGSSGVVIAISPIWGPL